MKTETYEVQIGKLLEQLTLEEKIGMIHGAGLFRTEGVERLSIPPLFFSDGPMGVRAEFVDNEWRNTGTTDDFVSYLPCNSAVASTWNRELAGEEGRVLGEEARGRGKDMILAPGINIKRSPFCGRNFEYADDGKCAMWKYAHENGIPDRIKENNLSDLAIQGEFCGAGIQKNRLKLKKPEWYVFTMIDLKPHRRLSLAKMKELCGILNLKMVPVEEERDLFEYDSIEELLERAKGKYTSGMNKEGIVIRPLEPVYSRIVEGPLSMKVLNNDYLLKE